MSTTSLLNRRIKFKESRFSIEARASRPQQIAVDLSSTSATASTDKKSTSTLVKPSSSVVKKGGLILSWPTPLPQGPGLHNLGNTCFLNSTLQCLSYTPPLALYLLSRAHSQSCRQGSFCTLCELESHVLRCFAVSRENTKAICPKSLVGRLKSIAKHLKVGRQEDAHEFLRYFVDSLQQGCLAGLGKVSNEVKESTIIQQIFGGYTRSQVKCTRCQHPSNTVERFLDISLEIKNSNTVEKAFAHFTKKELLAKDNMYKCSRCNILVEAIKQFTIQEAPPVLVLQLKRFEFGWSSHGTKVNKVVKFPQMLDITPFMSEQQERTTYQLYGVLVHAGHSCNSGHYYSYVKAPNGLWYCMNDSDVRQVSLQSVLDQTAYILFYSSNKPTVSPQKPLKQEKPAEAKPQTKTSVNTEKEAIKPQNPATATATKIPTNVPTTTTTTSKQQSSPKNQPKLIPVQKIISPHKPILSSSSTTVQEVPTSKLAVANGDSNGVKDEVVTPPLHATDVWKVSRKDSITTHAGGNDNKMEIDSVRPKANISGGFKEVKARPAVTKGFTASDHMTAWDDEDTQKLEEARNRLAESMPTTKHKRPSLSELEYDQGKKKKRKMKKTLE
ncbi:Ubiquitin carboxyl-terminal hydrolase 36 [Blyttiomyces sp. JEL0837]|nr:Ubiquitin carboxyl-terminal hydrolase 36 [Blyttiomyces sp. JEL0837]